jgi:hypothetical protein
VGNDLRQNDFAANDRNGSAEVARNLCDVRLGLKNGAMADKHGNGQSLRDLAERYPRYLGLPTAPDRKRVDGLEHEWLSVSSADFDAIAHVLRAFWVAFPERSYLAKGHPT